MKIYPGDKVKVNRNYNLMEVSRRITTTGSYNIQSIVPGRQSTSWCANGSWMPNGVLTLEQYAVLQWLVRSKMCPNMDHEHAYYPWCTSEGRSAQAKLGKDESSVSRAHKSGQYQPDSLTLLLLIFATATATVQNPGRSPKSYFNQHLHEPAAPTDHS